MTYGLILTLHIASFITNISLVVIADAIGLLWVLGKIKTLPKKVLRIIHILIWVGLALSITTGAILFSKLAGYPLEVPAFYAKLVFVLALIINSFFISHHLKTALQADSFAMLDKKTKRSFFLSGAVSTIGWVGAWVAARMLGL